MKRLKLPLNFRLQNFLFLQNDEIFWTSASLTLFQKIKRFLTKDKEYLCNTSRYYTLPIHGQYISLEGDNLVHNIYGEKTTYDLDSGRFIFKEKAEYISPTKIGRLVPNEYLQGFTFDSNKKVKYAVYGKPSKNYIYVKDIQTKETLIRLPYKPKWWWKYWEAEGIQLDDQGNIWIGISVKSKFGFLVNYIKKINS